MIQQLHLGFVLPKHEDQFKKCLQCIWITHYKNNLNFWGKTPKLLLQKWHSDFWFNNKLTWLNGGETPSVVGALEPATACAEDSKDNPHNQSANSQPIKEPKGTLLIFHFRERGRCYHRFLRLTSSNPWAMDLKRQVINDGWLKQDGNRGLEEGE